MVIHYTLTSIDLTDKHSARRLALQDLLSRYLEQLSSRV